MKTKIALLFMTLLAGLLGVSGPLRADQIPPRDDGKPTPTDVRALLEKGQASGALPEGMIVRVAACLGEPVGKNSRLPETMTEHWEFAAGQVHRIVFTSDDKGEGRRVDSRPFDSKHVCKDLLEGRAIEIHARKGKGPQLGFVGSRYGRGSRAIEVVWNGETILDLLETNGATLDLYRESDARAFGALYERLASQARAVFKSKGD